MRRFVYAPDVEAYISTDSGIIDVSADIISGSVTRRVNAASQATLVIQNPYHKYTPTRASGVNGGLIKPMDKIVIYLTRVKRMLVFSGYIDQAPLDQLYPEPVEITASCTIKRLLYTYWNPQLPYVTDWFAKQGWSFDPLTGNIFDLQGKSVWNMDFNSTLGQMIRRVMGDVGGWSIGEGGSRNSVQVLALPKKFVTVTSNLLTSELAAQQQQQDNVQAFLKSLLTVQGLTSDPYGSITGTTSGTYNLSDGQQDVNPLPLSLAGKYTAKTYGPKYPLSGFAASLQKECATSNDPGIKSLTTTNFQNAAIIAQTAISQGYTAKAAAGFVAVSYAESTLNATVVNSIGATGLMQLTAGGGYFGANGWLAKAVKQLTGQDVAPVSGDQYATNPSYNILALLIAHSGSRDSVNSAAEPYVVIEDLYENPGGTGSANPDYPKSSKFFPYAYAAIQAASTSNTDSSVSGNVGDVRVGNPNFLKKDPNHGEQVGYTFRIKPNPYGNNTYIFQAVSYDPSLKTNEISIYIPQDTVQAQNWSNGEVSIETSINLAQRFPNPTGSTAGGSVNIDPSTMTQQQLTGGGASTANLQPIALTGLAFIQTNFGPFKLSSGYRPPTQQQIKEGANSMDDHNKGLAVDLIPIDAHGNEWPADGVTRADALAKWAGFQQQPPSHSDQVQPDTQGNPSTRWVGWRYVGGHGPPSGAGAYPNGYPSQGSGPHLHVSFLAGASADSIPPANGQQSNNIAVNGTLQGTGVQVTQQNMTDTIASLGVGLPLVFPMAESAAEAQLFTGERAYQDDQALIEFIEFLCKSSGRHYQSLPNGDFLAFYPDYFNWSGQTPYFKISDIETQGLTINISDDPLATHVYTTADTMAAGSINFIEELSSTVASVESAKIFSDLINVGSNFNYIDFLKRYGARPLNKQVVEIKNSFMQFMYGWMTFLEQWAKLFNANPTFTFMPELYPGGLVQFMSKDLVMYVEEVTHNFDREGGFTTTASLIAPSTTGASTGAWTYGMVFNLANKK